jgi:hypothetical protein
MIYGLLFGEKVYIFSKNSFHLLKNNNLYFEISQTCKPHKGNFLNGKTCFESMDCCKPTTKSV